MGNEYRTLLALPDARLAVVAGFVARLPMSMLGVGLVLLVTSTIGSYTLSGALSGCLLVSQAMTGSLRGRLVDRFGARRAVLPVILVHCAGLVGILACCLLHGPAALLLVLGLFTGSAFPPVGALVRARWTAALGGGERGDGGPSLSSALSLESTLDAVIFVVGPVLTTTLAGVTVGAGVAAAMLCTLVGGVLFVTRADRAAAPPEPERRSASALRIGGMPVVAGICLVLGGVIGSAEVTVVAFTRQHGGGTSLVGPMVASLSLGSLLSGVVYGTRRWRGSVATRFVAAVVCLCVGTVPLMLVSSIPALAVAAALAGMSVTPTMIGAHELVQAMVPAAHLNEGYSWLQTAAGLGLGVGVPLAGSLTDAVGAHHAFLVTGGAAAVAALVAVLLRRQLRAAAGLQAAGSAAGPGDGPARGPAGLPGLVGEE